MKLIKYISTWGIVAGILLGAAFNTRTITFSIENNSYVTIHGRTNINKFSCDYKLSESFRIFAIQAEDDDSKIIFNHDQFHLDVFHFDCGNQMMTKDFRELLQAHKYPHITLELNHATKLDNELAEATLTVEILNTSKRYQIPVCFQINKMNQTYTGTLELDITDFGITPPQKMLGMVLVDKMIQIEFNLVVRDDI